MSLAKSGASTLRVVHDWAQGRGAGWELCEVLANPYTAGREEILFKRTSPLMIVPSAFRDFMLDFYFFFYFLIFWQNPLHAEVPMLEIKPSPQQ